MKIEEIVKILDAKVVYGESWEKIEIKQACASDLMSDVLAFAKSSSALLTGLVNPQVIRTAEMLDIFCVVFVRGKVPSEDVISLARQLDIVVLTTNYTQYYACGKLYAAGLDGPSRVGTTL